MCSDCVCKICSTNKAHVLLYLNVLVVGMVLSMAVLLDKSELLGSFLHSCEILCPVVPSAQQKQ